MSYNNHSIFKHNFRHILLKNPTSIGLPPSGQNFEIINTTSNTPIDLKINETYDLNSTSDNYYRKLPNSIISVYFWMLGRWDQMENWNYWPIIVLSIGTLSLYISVIMTA